MYVLCPPGTRRVVAARAVHWQASCLLASGLHSLCVSSSSFLTQITDKHFLSSHIWIMAFLTSCSGIETILFRWNCVDSSSENIFPRTALPSPFPLLPRPPQRLTHPLPRSHGSQSYASVQFLCCTPGELVPRDTSTGHPSDVPCPELFAVSHSMWKHPECRDACPYWRIPSFTGDLPGAATSGHMVASTCPRSS